MHLLTTVAWYSTWFSIVSDLHNHTNAARRPQRVMQTLLCKRHTTTSNLYRRRNCYTTHVAKAMSHIICSCIFDVELPQNECQLIDILDFLLAASMCCHRGCHRCNTVIHACLQPTRGLCLKAGLNFFVRSSGGRFHPQHNAKGSLGHLLTTVAWYSTWSLIVSDVQNHTTAARRPQPAMQTVLCKWPPTASNRLYRGRNCFTMHVAKATDMCSGHDCCASFASSNPRTTSVN